MYAQLKAREALERGDTARAAWWQSIAARVDKAPPLTPALRSQLAVLLRPAAT